MEEESLFNQELHKLAGFSPTLNDDFSLPNPLFMFFRAVKPTPVCFSDVDILMERREIEQEPQPKLEVPPLSRIPYDPSIHEIDDQNEPEKSGKIESEKGKLEGEKLESRAKMEGGRSYSSHTMTTRLKKRSDPWYNADVEICSASEAMAALSINSNTRQDCSLSLRFNNELQRLKNRSFRRVN